MTLKPLAGYVLIEPVDEEEVTASGLVMPDKEKEKPAKGTVIAVGASIPVVEARVMSRLTVDPDHGFLFEEAHVKEGDIVIFHKWAGQDVKEGQKEYRLVKFSDLMGIYE